MYLIKPYNQYGTEINSHDVLKFIAITAMIIDHIAYFFFPEATTLRLIGRVSMPIFLFLVGYSGKYKFDTSLFIQASVLVMISYVCQRDIFPVNILFSIILARLFLSLLENTQYLSKYLFFTFFALLFWYIPGGLITDYGSTALLMALAGHIIHRSEHKNFEEKLVFVLIFAFHIMMQLYMSNFVLWQQITFCLFMTLLVYIFYYYRLIVIKMDRISLISPIILFISRNSLLIYSLHFGVFIIIKHVFI